MTGCLDKQLKAAAVSDWLPRQISAGFCKWDVDKFLTLPSCHAVTLCSSSISKALLTHQGFDSSTGSMSASIWMQAEETQMERNRLHNEQPWCTSRVCKHHHLLRLLSRLQVQPCTERGQVKGAPRER